jgi:glycyl-tRNA synthetase beta chain
MVPLTPPTDASHRFFMEVGTEELPAGFLEGIESRIETGLRQALDALMLQPKTIAVHKTPRRLVIDIQGLPDMQPAREEVIKGPPAKIAYDAQGQPTKALEGFLKKTGEPLENASTETLGNETYVVFRKQVPGQAVKNCVGTLALNVVIGLEGPRFMRWANNTQTFPRPIRWLLAFWDETPLSLELPLGDDVLTSGTVTRGHRLLGEAEFSVTSPENYFAALETKGKVLLSSQERKTRVIEQLEARAKSLGGSVLIDDSLLEEVVNILEWPTVMAGTFDEAYLAIPKPVLITVMQAHQRYFPVQHENGSLMPCFLVVSNGDAAHEHTIVAGNERVLVARFEDARFFYEEDMKTPLEQQVKKLSGVTFQKGLGTLQDKTQRIQRLSYAFGEALMLDAPTRQRIERAALLCKADLVTAMVFELTELQGQVGMHYALKQGEALEVATAIFEHYLPRFQGDQLAETPEGMVVGLADKFDTLVALFSQSRTKMPSGSKDPLGLRRLVNGILLTVLAFNLSLNLETWCEHTYQNLGGLAQESWPETWERIKAFMHQRLQSYLNERDYAHDVIQAVAESCQPWHQLPAFVAKVESLAIKKQDAPDLLQQLYIPANRIDKMLGQHYIPDAQLLAVRETLLETGEDRTLFKAAASAVANPSTTALLALTEPVQAFFDGVMVMSENPDIRQNRITLLSVLHKTYMERFGRLSCLHLPEASSITHSDALAF